MGPILFFVTNSVYLFVYFQVIYQAVRVECLARSYLDTRG